MDYTQYYLPILYFSNEELVNISEGGCISTHSLRGRVDKKNPLESFWEKPVNPWLARTILYMKYLTHSEIYFDGIRAQLCFGRDLLLHFRPRKTPHKRLCTVDFELYEFIGALRYQKVASCTAEIEIESIKPWHIEDWWYTRPSKNHCNIRNCFNQFLFGRPLDENHFYLGEWDQQGLTEEDILSRYRETGLADPHLWSRVPGDEITATDEYLAEVLGLKTSFNKKRHYRAFFQAYCWLEKFQMNKKKASDLVAVLNELKAPAILFKERREIVISPEPGIFVHLEEGNVKSGEVSASSKLTVDSDWGTDGNSFRWVERDKIWEIEIAPYDALKVPVKYFKAVSKVHGTTARIRSVFG